MVSTTYYCIRSYWNNLDGIALEKKEKEKEITTETEQEAIAVMALAVVVPWKG